MLQRFLKLYFSLNLYAFLWTKKKEEFWTPQSKAALHAISFKLCYSILPATKKTPKKIYLHSYMLFQKSEIVKRRQEIKLNSKTHKIRNKHHPIWFNFLCFAGYLRSHQGRSCWPACSHKSFKIKKKKQKNKLWTNLRISKNFAECGKTLLIQLENERRKLSF